MAQPRMLYFIVTYPLYYRTHIQNKPCGSETSHKYISINIIAWHLYHLLKKWLIKTIQFNRPDTLLNASWIMPNPTLCRWASVSARARPLGLDYAMIYENLTEQCPPFMGPQKM